MLKESYWTKALEKEYSSFRKRHVHLFFIFCKTLEKEQILSFLISSFKALVMEEAERKLLNESLRKRGFFLSKAAVHLFLFFARHLKKSKWVTRMVSANTCGIKNLNWNPPSFPSFSLWQTILSNSMILPGEEVSLPFQSFSRRQTCIVRL